MSKINMNNKLIDFFQKNKTRVAALTMAAVMVGSLSACKSNTKENAEETVNSMIQLNEDELQKLKSNVKANINNMEVTKDDENGIYLIVENLYREIPIYGINDNNERYLVRIDSEHIGTKEYGITYSTAIYAGIDNVLDSKVAEYSKVK